jgi:carbon monoxide dehydrogenase subunit G
MEPISVTRHAAAPPETVWEVATDVAAWEAVLSGVDRIEVVSPPGPFGRGLRWRETRTIARRSQTEEMWVSAVDPGRSCTVESDSRGVHYVSTFAFAPAGDGSDLTLTFAAEVQGTVKRLLVGLMARVMTRSVAKQLARDLEDVVAAAERRAVA